MGKFQRMRCSSIPIVMSLSEEGMCMAFLTEG
jgi:hypothetical protein